MSRARPEPLAAAGRSLLLVGLAAIALLATACEPTCRQACRKLTGCELDSDRVTLDECEASCVFQQREYEDTEQDALRDRFGDHKSCLQRETCEDITAGVCYDAEIWVY